QSPITLDASGNAALTLNGLSVGTHAITATYSGGSGFTPSSSGTLTQTVNSSSTGTTTANQNWVARTYVDLLRRPVDAGGHGYRASLLDQGFSRTQVALALTQSYEYRLLQVRDAYQRYLHRDADAGGLAFYANYLLQGGSLNQLRLTFLASQE